VTFAVPPPLATGDLVAVVAPSGVLVCDELWGGLAWLRARYRIRIGTGIFARSGYLAGTDDRRRDELASAMLDHDVRAIVAARGGYGAMRVIDSLPWKEFAQSPKWIVGHSDVTALHAMAWSTSVASIHAPNVTGLGLGTCASTRGAWLAALERPTSERAWCNLRVVHPGDTGDVTGPIVGGNLALVQAMAAAGRLSIPSGGVLALEDVTEAPYRVDRMLTSLVLGGHLARAGAIVFGSFERCPAGVDGRTVDDVLDSCTRPLGIPILAGAPFGHGQRNEAFMLGALVRVRGDTVTWLSPR
jgi:muramoyltetrapeptide carboxypeptidase